jgi:hypothetical protein
MRPENPIPKILEEIDAAASDVKERQFSGVARTVAGFARLVAVLSTQADRLQRWVVVLTVAIAVMTAAILWLTWVMASK